MDVAFEDESLGRLCNDVRKLRRKHGQRRADRILMRLQAMLDARSLEDLRNAPGKFHELTVDRAGQLSCDLDQPYRLIFRPAQNPPPARPGGGLDWSQVDAVVIVEIADTHE